MSGKLIREINSKFGKQIRSSGNKFGVREINSEFGKSFRSSGNHFGVRRKISGIIHYCACIQYSFSLFVEIAANRDGDG